MQKDYNLQDWDREHCGRGRGCGNREHAQTAAAASVPRSERGGLFFCRKK